MATKKEARWMIAEIRQQGFMLELDDATQRPRIEPLAKLTLVQRQALKENVESIREELVRESDEIYRRLREWVESAG